MPRRKKEIPGKPDADSESHLDMKNPCNVGTDNLKDRLYACHKILPSGSLYRYIDFKDVDAKGENDRSILPNAHIRFEQLFKHKETESITKLRERAFKKIYAKKNVDELNKNVKVFDIYNESYKSAYEAGDISTEKYIDADGNFDPAYTVDGPLKYTDTFPALDMYDHAHGVFKQWTDTGGWKSPGSTFVVSVNGKPMGLMSCIICNNYKKPRDIQVEEVATHVCLYVNDIYVDDEYSGNGIGKLMLWFAKQLAVWINYYRPIQTQDYFDDRISVVYFVTNQHNHGMMRTGKSMHFSHVCSISDKGHEYQNAILYCVVPGSCKVQGLEYNLKTNTDNDTTMVVMDHKPCKTPIRLPGTNNTIGKWKDRTTASIIQAEEDAARTIIVPCIVSTIDMFTDADLTKQRKTDKDDIQKRHIECIKMTEQLSIETKSVGIVGADLDPIYFHSCRYPQKFLQITRIDSTLKNANPHTERPARNRKPSQKYE